MSRFCYTDIVTELCELSRDSVSEIRQQLSYYRASVYKNETAKTIKYRIEKLRFVAKVINDDTINEAFNDYDAVNAANLASLMPGECSFSTRSSVLLSEIEARCEEILHAVAQRTYTRNGRALAQSVHRHRRELLSMCRQGSRHWAFFQTL